MLSAVGCNFHCGNKKCSAFLTGFNINGSWPLGRIDEVIQILREEYGYDEDNDVIRYLEQRKENDVTVAAIPTQTKSKIEVVGNRHQCWCDKCSTIWDQDDIEGVEKSDKCPRCSGWLRDFNSLIEDGINCPHCKERLKEERYYSKGDTDDK